MSKINKVNFDGAYLRSFFSQYKDENVFIFCIVNFQPALSSAIKVTLKFRVSSVHWILKEHK